MDRYTRVAIKSGHPIRANELFPPNELPPLKVAEGMRAVTIQVGDHAGMLDGMVKSGDFVDVLFTYQGNNDDALQGGLTMRLFEGVRVLAVSRGPSTSRNNFVTLEMTEPQANVVTLARDRGTLTLTYNPNGRGNGGLALSSSERVTLYEILGLKQADPSEPFLTEIYRGSGRATNRFNDKGKLMENYVAPGMNARPRQQLVPVPKTSDTPAAPVKPTDANAGDQPTSPTASRILLEQK
jgi:pilus assembly protein CpaB